MSGYNPHRSDNPISAYPGLPAPLAVIIPTLDDRVHGMLYPAHPGYPAHSTTQQLRGLVLLSDGSASAPTLAETLARLCADCQIAGITVVEVTHVPSLRESVTGDSETLALDLLAAVSYLYAQGVTDVAVVFAVDAVSALPLHERQEQLLARCIAACSLTDATPEAIARRIASLTGMIRAAMDSIRGIISVQMPHHTPDQQANVLSEASFSSDNARSSFVIAPDEVGDSEAAQRVARALYDWACATLAGKQDQQQHAHDMPATLAIQERKMVAQRAPADLPIPSSTLPAVRQYVRYDANPVASRRAQIAQAKMLMRQNLQYLQAQWSLLLVDLEKRDATRAMAIRTLLDHEHMSNDNGADDAMTAIRAVRLSWQLLDAPARQRWLAAWERAFSGFHNPRNPDDAQDRPAYGSGSPSQPSTRAALS
jgi:hypothetical protein